jgi:hypothetical protein
LAVTQPPNQFKLVSVNGEGVTRLELFLAGVAENADLPSLSKRILLPELGDERHEANLPYL